MSKQAKLPPEKSILTMADKNRLEAIWRDLWEISSRESNADRWARALTMLLEERKWTIVDRATLEIVYFDLSNKDKP